MGTRISMTVAAASAEEGEAAIEAGMAEVRRLDAMMSLYRDDSEIARVNRAAGMHSVTVSPEMIEVVESAATVSSLSGGVFDVTIGPLVVLWQMRLKEGTVPSDEEIARVRALVNYRNIVVDRKASTLFLKKRGMIMDFGGMKGYIADRVVDVLRSGASGTRWSLSPAISGHWDIGRTEGPGGSACSIRVTRIRPWPYWN